MCQSQSLMTFWRSCVFNSFALKIKSITRELGEEYILALVHTELTSWPSKSYEIKNYWITCHTSKGKFMSDNSLVNVSFCLPGSVIFPLSSPGLSSTRGRIGNVITYVIIHICKHSRTPHLKQGPWDKQGDPVCKSLVPKAGDQSSSPSLNSFYLVEGKNQFSQVVLWWPHRFYGICTHV